MDLVPPPVVRLERPLHFQFLMPEDDAAETNETVCVLTANRSFTLASEAGPVNSILMAHPLFAAAGRFRDGDRPKRGLEGLVDLGYHVIQIRFTRFSRFE